MITKGSDAGKLLSIMARAVAVVLLQSKGDDLPRYARWSRDAVKLWPPLQKELLELNFLSRLSR